MLLALLAFSMGTVLASTSVVREAQPMTDESDTIAAPESAPLRGDGQTSRVSRAVLMTGGSAGDGMVRKMFLEKIVNFRKKNHD